MLGKEGEVSTPLDEMENFHYYIGTKKLQCYG